MSNKIFISYRRADSADITDRIYDYLVQAFGKKNIFKDVDSIGGGVDFRHSIEQALNRCWVVLVIIGPTWVNLPDHLGRPRLADSNDVVRLEVEAALQRKTIPVIPVLVGGATMPSSTGLSRKPRNTPGWRLPTSGVRLS